MTLTAYVVDAFAGEIFRGNPAAVVPLEAWLPDELMQAMAAEHNLAETAYFVREAEGYRLRWFTPKVEVDLCGHATVAAAFVLKNCLGMEGGSVAFESRSGKLGVEIADGIYTLDFPSRPATVVPADEFLVAGLGAAPQEVLAARDYLVRFDSEEEVRALEPDFATLKRCHRFAVIATAPGAEAGVDFVSRFFAPAQGIDEDPVTGSAHSTLIPYWAGQLGKAKLFARQISERGGQLHCELAGDRVKIGGQAVLYSKNEIYIPG
jgi:predicted PhzF superfamily epimerase YddE/YHI9